MINFINNTIFFKIGYTLFYLNSIKYVLGYQYKIWLISVRTARKEGLKKDNKRYYSYCFKSNRTYVYYKIYVTEISFNRS